MNVKKLFNIVIINLVIGLFIFSNPLTAQDSTYYPKGNPDVLNIEINPFLWLPAISGELTSKQLSEDFDTPATDLISDLRFAFMLNAEVSKGKFFAAPSYIYAKLGTDEVLKTNNDGNDAIVAHPGLVMNIFELLGGMRIQPGEKVYLDSYIGFRYTNYTLEGWIDEYGPMDTTSTSFEESANYWDPVVGCRLHYYPHPRVPLTLKADIGGFGVGSTLSWTAAFNGGYTLSPTVDLVAGVLAYGSDFEKENELGNNVGLNVLMYGFDVGVRIMIPARSKDPSIFKKTKNK